MAGYESIETPDAGTVVVTFGAPNSAFLPIVAAPYMGIINSELAEANGASAGADAPTDTAEEWFLSNSAGSGPYQLESYTQGESLVFARNDNYWGPNKPAFPKVTMLQVKDSSSQLQQLQQGDVDIAMQISFDSVGQLEGDPNVSVQLVDSFNFVHIALSPGAVGGENLQDVKVRSTRWSPAMARSRPRRSRTASSAAPTCHFPSTTRRTPRRNSTQPGWATASRSTPPTPISTSTASTSA
jgi:peptide/nickel transport system substrate-binding protein